MTSERDIKSIEIEKIENLIFKKEQLIYFVCTEFIRPLGGLLKKKLNNVLDFPFDALEKFDPEETVKTRVLFLAYNPISKMLHFLPINKKFTTPFLPENARNEGIERDILLKSFIGRAPDYLDPFNPFEVTAEPKGLTQMTLYKSPCKNAAFKKAKCKGNIKKPEQIAYSDFAALDERSFQKTSYDVLFGIHKTLYIPIPNLNSDDKFWEGNALGVIILTTDYDPGCIDEKYEQTFEKYESSCKKFLKKVCKEMEIIKNGKRVIIENLEMGLPDEASFISSFKKLEKSIKERSEILQDRINQTIRIAEIFEDGEANWENPINILKKFLMQHLSIYQQYITLMEPLIMFELEKLYLPHRGSND